MSSAIPSDTVEQTKSRSSDPSSISLEDHQRLIFQSITELRNSAVNSGQDDITAKPNLNSAARHLQILELADGGANAPQFQKDLSIINFETHKSFTKGSGTVLPDLTITGVNARGAIEVRVSDAHQDPTQHGHFTDNTNLPASAQGTLECVDGFVEPVYKGDHPSDVTLFGPNGPSVSDISQGNQGDCQFLAAAAGLANTPQGRRQLEDMITNNHDGTYTVRFKGANLPVDVPAPTLYDLNTFAGAPNNAIWPAVLEEAFKKYTGEDLGNGPGYARESHIGNSSLLTGNEQFNYSVGFNSSPGTYSRNGHLNEADALSTIKNALQQGAIVTAGVSSNPETPESISDQTWYKKGHEYSVLNVSSVDGQEMVTLRNPWGSHGQEGMPAGEIEIPVDQFIDGWSTVSVSSTKPQEG